MQLARNVNLSESRIRDARRLVEAHPSGDHRCLERLPLAEATNVSRHCMWIFVDDEELAIPYSDFPWIKGGTVEQLVNVLRQSEDHLY